MLDTHIPLFMVGMSMQSTSNRQTVIKICPTAIYHITVATQTNI